MLSGAKTLGWELHPWQLRDAAAKPLVSVELDAKLITAEQVQQAAQARRWLHCCHNNNIAACSMHMDLQQCCCT
jgi:hypothetical protein